MGARQGSESVALKDGSQDHLARTHEVSPLVEGSPLARMQPVADDLARYTHIYHIYITYHSTQAWRLNAGGRRRTWRHVLTILMAMATTKISTNHDANRKTHDADGDDVCR